MLSHLARLIASAPHNLVARGERVTVLQRHLRECVAVGLAIDPPPRGQWLDLGTGGGLPGLVLAAQHPAVSWVLLDATRKKVATVAGFVDALGLANVTPLAGRAETLAQGPWRGRLDGVVSRAVAPMATLLELARGFLGPDGRFVAVKGPNWEAELGAAREAIGLLRFVDVHSTRLSNTVRPAWLVTMRALGAPPDGFPRRDGVPRSQPLGGPTP